MPSANAKRLSPIPLKSDANWKLIAPLILHKKRYIFLASFSLFLHICGALWVIKHLSLNTWTESLQSWRLWLHLNVGLDSPDHEHDEKQILIVWMLAIQTRYVLSDSYAVYMAVKKRRLLWATVSTHLVEGAICALFFLGHNSKDCFVFGLTCVIWTLLWCGAYVAMDYDRLMRGKDKLTQRFVKSKKNFSFETLRSKLGGSLSPYRGWGVGTDTEDEDHEVKGEGGDEGEGVEGGGDGRKSVRKRRGRSRTRK